MPNPNAFVAHVAGVPPTSAPGPDPQEAVVATPGAVRTEGDAVPPILLARLVDVTPGETDHLLPEHFDEVIKTVSQRIAVDALQHTIVAHGGIRASTSAPTRSHVPSSS